MDLGRMDVDMEPERSVLGMHPEPELHRILDVLVSPSMFWEPSTAQTISDCNFFIAQGRTWDDFAREVKNYDNTPKCSKVWAPKMSAYRCLTCCKSNCMSICIECFQNGNHQRHNHNFSMFVSESGGACDCGDVEVMKESGFCDAHSTNRPTIKPTPPVSLTLSAELLMPRIILRAMLAFRITIANSSPSSRRIMSQDDISEFLGLLLDFIQLGGVMRKIIANALTNPQKYRQLNSLHADPRCSTPDCLYLIHLDAEYKEYVGMHSVPPEFQSSCRALQANLTHETFLEELVFWTVAFGFPESPVRLLLKLMPDPDFKKSLTKAFILHYFIIAHKMREPRIDAERLIKTTVKISVQLFSNANLTSMVVQEMNLLEVMLQSLHYVFDKAKVRNEKCDLARSDHTQYVVDPSADVIARDAYSPFVSDLKMVLSKKLVVERFVNDLDLLWSWFSVVFLMQEMNVHTRISEGDHVEEDPPEHTAAFLVELNACAYPMWSVLAHFSDSCSADMAKKVLKTCSDALVKWLEEAIIVADQVSFHFPLHRYFSVLLRNAVLHQGVQVTDVLPPKDDLLMLGKFLIQLQATVHQIQNNFWCRNGDHMKFQVQNYASKYFCYFMLDADIHFLQVCCAYSCPNRFLSFVFATFTLGHWLRSAICKKPGCPMWEQRKDDGLLEGLLVFLAVLTTDRSSIGLSDTEMNKLEMATLLSVRHRTHAELVDLIPETCQTTSQRDFQHNLETVSTYTCASLDTSGNFTEGMFSPNDHLWEEVYDPVHLLLRTYPSSKGDFQESLERYTQYVRRKTGSAKGLWPPFRTPTLPLNGYEDPRILLRSSQFHGAIFMIFLEALNGKVTESVMSLAVFLLEQSVLFAQTRADEDQVPGSGSNLTESSPSELGKEDMFSIYQRDHVFYNFTVNVDVTCWSKYRHPDCAAEESPSTSTSPPSEASPTTIGNEAATEPIYESLASVLLKLHSQLSGRPNSFNPEEALTDDLGSRNGPYYIGKLLRTVAAGNETCRKNILEERAKIWPPTDGAEKKTSDMELRRKRVRERQQEMMEQFASKQKRFIENMDVEFGDLAMDDQVSPEEQEEVYHCVVCNCGGSSEGNDQMCLLILLQKTNYKAHRRRFDQEPERLSLPLNDVEKSQLPPKDEKRLKECRGHVVQTCGHYVHPTCLVNYVKSGLHIVKNVIACPLCRQLWNVMLPVKISRQSTNARTELDIEGALVQLEARLKDATFIFPHRSTPALSPMVNLMNEIDIVQAPWNWRPVFRADALTCFESAYSTAKIVHTYIEIALLQRGDNLATDKIPHSKLKLAVIEPLLRTAIVSHQEGAFLIEVLRGMVTQRAEMLHKPGYPMFDLMRMELLPAALIILPAEKELFDVVVQAHYNLLYCHLKASRLFHPTGFSPKYPTSRLPGGSESKMQKHCLPFLRHAAILKHCIFKEPLPEVPTLQDEFRNLAGYLRLGASGVDQQGAQSSQSGRVTAMSMLRWRTVSDSVVLPVLWAKSLMKEVGSQRSTLRGAAFDSACISLRPPTLLQLPHEYDKIYSFYHSEYCSTCDDTPSTEICLICGGTFRDDPCNGNAPHKAWGHVATCGNGTGVILQVETTQVVVIVNGKSANWGTLYLDEFDCEDINLKRGRPLYLKEERFKLLEQQWVGHQLEQLNLNWMYDNFY